MSLSSQFRRRVAAVGFLAILGFFLVTEHRVHLFGILPFLFLLACPLLHLFGHGSHSGGHDHSTPGAGGQPERHAGPHVREGDRQ